MELAITGRNLDLTPPLRTYVERKIGKLYRYLDNVNQGTVELSMAPTKSTDTRYTAQATLFVAGKILRGEARSTTSLAAVDEVAEIMQRQIVRYKEKLSGRAKAARRRESAAAAVLEAVEQRSAAEEEATPIVKTKRFAIKPMDPDEAIDQMELLGHDFFVFLNPTAGRVNVVYRRKDRGYGLIDPEFG